jgi:hypothetical protein
MMNFVFRMKLGEGRLYTRIWTLERLGRLRESIRVRREASIEEAKRSKTEREELLRAVENLTRIRKAATAAVLGMSLLAVAGIQYL